MSLGSRQSIFRFELKVSQKLQCSSASHACTSPAVKKLPALTVTCGVCTAVGGGGWRRGWVDRPAGWPDRDSHLQSRHSITGRSAHILALDAQRALLVACLQLQRGRDRVDGRPVSDQVAAGELRTDLGVERVCVVQRGDDAPLPVLQVLRAALRLQVTHILHMVVRHVVNGHQARRSARAAVQLLDARLHRGILAVGHEQEAVHRLGLRGRGRPDEAVGSGGADVDRLGRRLGVVGAEVDEPVTKGAALDSATRLHVQGVHVCLGAQPLRAELVESPGGAEC
eukprot:scaffold87934_cov42-Phaeocystis_antarctica.AAC.2